MTSDYETILCGGHPDDLGYLVAEDELYACPLNPDYKGHELDRQWWDKNGNVDINIELMTRRLAHDIARHYTVAREDCARFKFELVEAKVSPPYDNPYKEEALF